MQQYNLKAYGRFAILLINFTRDFNTLLNTLDCLN